MGERGGAFLRYTLLVVSANGDSLVLFRADCTVIDCGRLLRRYSRLRHSWTLREVLCLHRATDGEPIEQALLAVQLVLMP